MAQHGEIALRAEVVDATIKGMAARMYKFKQAVSIVPTSAISNVYWTESAAVVSAKGEGNAFEGVPFGANFPHAVADHTRRQSNIVKHAVETNIAWELIKSSEIDVQGRNLFKLTEGITKSVDDNIYTDIQENQNSVGGTPKNINFIRITQLEEWTNSASSAIVDVMNNAAQLIGEHNYSTANLMMFVNLRDRRSIMDYVYSKGSQTPSLATDVAINGHITKLSGIDIIESNSVPASAALVVVPKICATWKAFEPLTTDTTVDPLKSVRIRVIEEGILQLTDPKAVCLIVNTQRASDV